METRTMVDGSVLRRLVLESRIPAHAADAVRDPRVHRISYERIKVGRNAPCPCGSGKKWKRCHGRPGP